MCGTAERGKLTRKRLTGYMERWVGMLPRDLSPTRGTHLETRREAQALRLGLPPGGRWVGDVHPRRGSGGSLGVWGDYDSEKRTNVWTKGPVFGGFWKGRRSTSGGMSI